MNSHHFPDVSQLKLPCVDILSKMDCFSVFPWRKLSWRFIRFLGWICSIPTKSYHPVHPGQTSSYLAVAFFAYHPCSILFMCPQIFAISYMCIYIYIIHCIMWYNVYIYIFLSSICGQSISKYSTYCYIIDVEISRIILFLYIFLNPIQVNTSPWLQRNHPQRAVTETIRDAGRPYQKRSTKGNTSAKSSWSFTWNDPTIQIDMGNSCFWKMVFFVGCFQNILIIRTLDLTWNWNFNGEHIGISGYSMI